MLIQLRSKKKATEKTMQIFDLLHLSRKEREYRILCQKTIRRFEDWKKKRESDSAWNMYVQIEGLLLRRQAQDAVLFYRMVRKDRIKIFQDYIAKLPDRTKFFSAAS